MMKFLIQDEEEKGKLQMIKMVVIWFCGENAGKMPQREKLPVAVKQVSGNKQKNQGKCKTKSHQKEKKKKEMP